MPDLSFAVDSAAAVPFAAAPTINFALRVSSDSAGKNGAPPASIHTIVLRCQIRIEPQRRGYEQDEKQLLHDLFGEEPQWGQTLRPMLWTHASLVVPPFTGQTTVQLPVACTSDFTVAAAKYFYALDDGEVPLVFLFSGTVFYAGNGGALQVWQIPWEKEARYRLPVSVWKQMMELYFPHSAWLRLHKDTFDRLYEYKMSRGLPTWEAAVDELIAEQKLRVQT